MKLLFIQCPCAFGVEMPPLGLAYLSSFLKKNNYGVSTLDLNILLYQRVNEENKKYWQSNQGYRWYLEESFYDLPFIGEDCYDEFVEMILSFESDILGFSVQNTSAMFTLEIIKRIKSQAPSKKIILGGPNCYDSTPGCNADFRIPHNLQKFADIVVVGEGEKTLLNVLRQLELDKSLNECSGIAIPKENKWEFNGFAEPVRNLDKLPFPDFDAYNLEAYTDKATLPILATRGCVMGCVFCTDTSFWRPYRYRSAENVIAEIMERKKNYKISSISLNDSLINGTHRNLLEICNLLIRRKINITWGGNCRVDRKLDLRLLKKMKKAGCNYLIFGLESGSNKILKLMRKGFSIEEAERILDYCMRVGIDVIANWIVGFPGETKEDFLATVNFIKKHDKQIKRNTFSTLTINQFSYLQNHKEEFGITLDSAHLGLWKTKDGLNTIELRNIRLKCLEDLEKEKSRDYNIVRQTANTL